MKHIVLLLLVFVTTQTALAQDKGISYGITGGVQLNSAILPELELNDNVNAILSGDDVVKGKPQLADFKLNFKLGGFVKYEDGFGFTLFETNYTPTKIYKEFKINTGTPYIPNFTYMKIDEQYSYLDISLSYNVYLYKGLYFGVGATPSFLLNYSGDVAPQKSDLRAFAGLGIKVNEKVALSLRGELGINEVYKDSYIHHIMIPLSISLSL